MLKVIALMLFLLSGLTSLIYETIWIRTLSLGVGATSTSMSIVLSIFFFGLSAGSYLASRYANRINNPLLFYGITEGLIGLYTPFLIFVLLYFHKILALLPLSGSFGFVGVFAKFFIVFVLLIIPTILMGLTLPLLVKYFTKEDAHVGKSVSFLYGINTFGAFSGAVLGSFLFIPTFGILLANNIMATLNISVFLVILFLSKKYLPKTKLFNVKKTTVEEKTKKVVAKITEKYRVIFLTCFLTGFASIAFEVVWNKYLGIFFGTNIYGLGIILSLYLLGIGLGSTLLSIFYARIKNITEVFIILLFLALLLSIAASYLLNISPITTSIIGFYVKTHINLLVIKTFVTVFILVLPTLAFGALLPLAISMLSESAADAPAVTGKAYAWNTIGAILGSYLAGIILIPNIGSGNTIKVALAALILAGAVVIYKLLRDSDKKLKYGLALLFIAIFAISTANIDFKNIIKSAYNQNIGQQTALSEVIKYYTSDYEEFKLIIEGKTGVISLSHDPQDGQYYRNYFRLKTNGLNESIYNKEDLKTLPKYEALLGLLSYLFVKDPQTAFVVGFGGGYTVDFLTTTQMTSVYVAELEEGILQAARYVYGNNNPILGRKNLRLEIEDARYVMNIGKKESFDIIVSQPSHSWLSGVANLFTLEYFEIVKRNLSHKGVFSQWLNLYNLNETVLKSILKTFYTVFPHGAVFTDLNDQEMIMIGSKAPLELDMQKLLTMTKDETYSKMLAGIPFTDPFNALTNYSLNREEILRLAGEAELNTDINAYAETRQSALFYSADKYNQTPQAFLSQNFTGDFSYILNKEYAEGSDFVFKMLAAYKNNSKYDKFYTVLQSFEGRNFQKTPENLKQLGMEFYSVERYASAETTLKEALKLKQDSETLNYVIASLTASRKFEEAIKTIKQYANLGNASTLCYKAELLFENKKYDEYKSFVKAIVNNEKLYLEKCGVYFYKLKGYYQYLNNDYSNALGTLNEYYKIYPREKKIISIIMAAYLASDQTKNALAFTSTMQSVVEGNEKRLKEMADYYKSKGLDADAEILMKLSAEE